ncbi:SulP family inorganic anion transporter [Chamaesiphon minutus]|uniref:Sulfate permease-like transporter, MFS superfamily n=1 Tax=Chamaesiphon minutus (strain ATCC 27169 / PCC 6605) TaxID=1173020 RepID=K9UD35_CHAP6|nr:SulP family inorganic anion transporter [Chamaesiphon minutus]AFY93022.1 sulfate permease-like transporter, MFS superfamily [Chamaesiphon minutus PCC 6605]
MNIPPPPARHRPRLFQGILPLNRANIGNDIIGGIVLAAIGIPEVMGYTKISGTPIATGLYTLLLPAIIFAILGSSRHLVVAADSATAAILAAGLSGLAPVGNPHYLALAEAVAILVAGILFLARVFRLGFLADFLSRTVLIGFLTGVGIQVAIGQLTGLLDLKGGGNQPLQQILTAIEGLPHANHLAIGISLAVLITIQLFERFIPKFPGALLAVVVAIFASWQFNFASHGVNVVGAVPSGLPAIGLPAISASELPQILGIALSCCIVIVAQSAATSRAYAFRYSEGFNENVDLEGLAAANLAAGLTGTFVVNGSPTKTEIVDTAGGRSQVAQLATVAVVLVVILFLTQPISYLPNPVLAAIVFSIGLRLVDTKGLRSIFKTHREEFYLAIVTAATVVFIGVKEGIIVAVMLSLILHVRHSYRPHSAIVIPDEHRLWQTIPVQMGSVSAPGLIIYRFSRDLFYANATFFSEEIEGLVKSANPPVRWLILEARAITDIDYSASLTIRDVAKELAAQNVTFVISGLPPEPRRQFDRDGLTDLIGTDRFFNHLEEALAIFY